MKNSDEGNCNGAEGQEDDQLLTKTAPFDGLVLILSEAGKPIFYRFNKKQRGPNFNKLSGGNEEEICAYFGIISVIVQRYHTLIYGKQIGVRILYFY